jgi:hypothetical protein
MDRWLEAYGKWPALSQMAFSLSVLVLGLVLLFVAGTVLAQVCYYLGVWFRGWPPASRPPTDRETSAARSGGDAPVQPSAR